MDIQYVDSMNHKARQLRHQDTRHALKLCSLARDIAYILDYRIGLAQSIHLISVCQFILADDENILETSFQALSLFQSLEDRESEAESLNLIALHYDRQNRDSLAIHYLFKSLAIRRSTGDVVGQAGSLNNIALVYCKKAQYADALDALFQSLSIAESSGDSICIAYALCNIGQVLTEIGDLKKAKEYHFRSLDLIKTTDDRAFESSIRIGLGRIFTREGNDREAYDQLDRSLTIVRLTGNLHDEALTLLQLGLSLQHFNLYKAAEKPFAEALAIMKKMNDRFGEVSVIMAIGKNSLLRGRFEKAIETLSQALDIATDLQSERQCAEIHENLTDAYEGYGNPVKALHHYRTYNETLKGIHNQESERRIRTILMRPEIERAQKEVEDERERNDQMEQALLKAHQVELEKETLIQELEAQTELLKQLAHEDGLTKVANRRWLDIVFRKEFERAKRFNHQLSIAMIDLDDFKLINDNFSHLVGDEVLRTVACILNDRCRSVDLVGRYGGEEFMLILIETSLESARIICEEIRESIANYHWERIDSRLKSFTVSIGVCDNAQMNDSVEMIALADSQLYRSKQRGKNRISWLERD